MMGCGMKIEIKTQTPYEVIIEPGVIDRVGEIAKEVEKPGAKVLLVSDSNVFPLYGERIKNALKRTGFSVFQFVFPAGETHKQIATVCEMYQVMSEAGFTRTDFLVTLGGGVAGDMGGFAAATFLRGVSFIQVPTSLLAQVDASVGGKTGVDLPFGKNLVGAFYQPAAVVTDPDTLKTLPTHFFNDGMGEVIKYGCIANKKLFEALEDGTALNSFGLVLEQCVSCKKELVEEDVHDKGRRMLLNFGHTFGHALEKLHNFTGMSHGEAVGVGMVLASSVGERLGVTKPGTAKQIENVLAQYGLPVSDSFSKEEIVAATVLDKKSDGDTLRMILLSEIGESLVYPIERDKLLKAM